MIKIKTFEASVHAKYLDDDINGWLVENDVDVMDIKFSTGWNGRSFVASAMLIYKEKRD